MVTGPFSARRRSANAIRMERISLRANIFRVVAQIDEKEKRAIKVDEQWTEAGNGLAPLS